MAEGAETKAAIWHRLAPALVSLVVLSLAWELAARIAANPLFFPPPSKIARGFYEAYATGSIFPHIAASLWRCLAGFLAAAFLAIPFGVMVGYFSVLRRFLDPLVGLFRPVPPLALIPLLILWFGIGELSKVILIFIACFFPIFISTEHGVSRVDPVLLRAARLLGASQLDVLRKVIIPGAFPEIFTGLRISLALSLLAIVAAELVAANRGLGFLILEAQRTYDTVGVFVGIISIALLGFTLDFLMKQVRHRAMPWLKV